MGNICTGLQVYLIKPVCLINPFTSFNTLHMNKILLISLLVGISLHTNVKETGIQGKIALIHTVTECPECCEHNCIYNLINETVKGEGTDQQIEDAIIHVCLKLGITDPFIIQELRNSYYL